MSRTNANTRHSDDVMQKFSELPNGAELRVESLLSICRNLSELQKIAVICEEKRISVVFENDNLVLDGKSTPSLSSALGLVMRARKILVSAATKEGLNKAVKMGKKLGCAPGRNWKNKKLDGKENEITNLLNKGLSRAAVARALHVDIKTLRSFLQRDKEGFRKASTSGIYPKQAEANGDEDI